MYYVSYICTYLCTSICMYIIYVYLYVYICIFFYLVGWKRVYLFKPFNNIFEYKSFYNYRVEMITRRSLKLN